jgi:hypothetical protein
MNTKTLELKVPEPVYLALQSAIKKVVEENS